MNHRPALIVQILEKLGLPLTAAVTAVAADKGVADVKKEAELVAELLSSSVKVGLSVSRELDLSKTEEDDADSVRLALAAIAAELLAGQYRSSLRMPAEKDMDRITKSLSAVLAFSENFSEVAKNASRLKLLNIEEAAFDENQVSASCFKTLAPVIDAVALYPFGRPEVKLVQEVAGRLLQAAGDLGKKLFGSSGLSEPEKKQMEFSLLSAAATIYTECHRAETDRILAMKDAEREKMTASGGKVSMDAVWQAFETRCAMLEALSSAILTGSSGPEAAAGEGASPTPPPPPTAETKAEAPSIFSKKPGSGPEPEPEPAQTPAEAPPSQPPESPDPQDGQAANPMSFFRPGKQKSGDQEEE